MASFRDKGVSELGALDLSFLSSTPEKKKKWQRTLEFSPSIFGATKEGSTQEFILFFHLYQLIHPLPRGLHLSHGPRYALLIAFVQDRNYSGSVTLLGHFCAAVKASRNHAGSRDGPVRAMHHSAVEIHLSDVQGSNLLFGVYAGTQVGGLSSKWLFRGGPW